MNAKQQDTIRIITGRLLDKRSNGGRTEVEVKRQEIKEVTDTLVYLIIEIGLVDDEGTMAARLCRDSRRIFIGPRGGVELANAKYKSKSKGLFNAIHEEVF